MESAIIKAIHDHKSFSTRVCLLKLFVSIDNLRGCYNLLNLSDVILHAAIVLDRVFKNNK